MKHFTSLAIFLILGFFLLSSSCTDVQSSDEYSQHEFVEIAKVVVNDNGTEFIYPNEFVIKARNNGINELNMLPEYESPDIELFQKFQSDVNFSVNLDGVSIDQDDLSEYDRSEIKAYFVRGISSSNQQGQYLANLYTHDGYMKMTDRWIETLTKFRDR